MKRYLTLFGVLFAVVLTACEHKDLCSNHRDHAHRYHINVIADYRYDWEEYFGYQDWKNSWPENYLPYDDLRPGDPSGLRVVNFNEAGDYNLHNIGAHGGVVNLYEGKNNLLFYNNDTEYIVFSSFDNMATTRATTRVRTRASYTGNTYADEDEPTLTPPDMLYANYFEGYIAEKVVDPADVYVTLQPLVFSYKIRYEFKAGLQYVSMARGALSGMASSVLLVTGETSSDAATLLYDCEVTDFGARAIVNSFGIPGFPHPNYPTRESGKHALNLEILMKNGKTITKEFDVTEQVKAQPHGGVIVVDGIEITDEEGKQGSGAFDVVVDDWGDYQEIPLPLM